MDKWKLIEASKDPKDLWKKIDWKGELNNKSIETSSNVNEFAEVLEKRCLLPKEDTFYDDIPKKCTSICINSHEKEPIDIKSGTIKYSSETVYLGSMITNQGNINYDIKHEIKGKEKAFNKFFAFLHKNCNAPLKVKLKVLQSCLYSSVLYNCETWSNVNMTKIEKQYNATLKYILGIRNQCCKVTELKFFILV